MGNNSGCNSKMYFEKVVLSYVRKVCLNKFISGGYFYEPDYDLLNTYEIIQLVNTSSDSKESDKSKEVETEQESEESNNQNSQYQTPIQQYQPQYQQNQPYPPQYQQNQPYFSKGLFCQRCGQNHMIIQTSTKKEISHLSVILIIIIVPLALYLFIFFYLEFFYW